MKTNREINLSVDSTAGKQASINRQSRVPIIGGAGIRWEVDGDLFEVQGSVQRASEIFVNEECKFHLDEDSRSSASYTFTHEKFGSLGSIRIIVFPKNKTEVYGYPPEMPDKKWLIEYLPKNVLWSQLGDLVMKLIKTYAWQIEEGVFEKTAIELFHDSHDKKEIDMGWNIYGLEDLEMQKQAEAELEKWRQMILDRRIEEFNQIKDVILTQIRLDGLSLKIFDGQTMEGRFLKSTISESDNANIAKEPLMPIGEKQTDSNEAEKQDEKRHIPRETKAREQKIREVIDLDIPEWQKAQMVGTGIRQFQRDKVYFGLAKPRKKAT